MNRFPARSPHLRRDCAHPATSALRLGLTPATSVPRLGSPLPHLHRDWARPYAQRSHPHFSPARCHGSAHTHAARRQAAEAGCDSRTHAHAVQAQMWAGASPVPAQMCQRQASPPSDMRMMSRIAPRASSVELMYLRQVPAQMWPLRSWADVAEKGAYVEFRAKKTEPFAYLTHDAELARTCAQGHAGATPSGVCTRAATGAVAGIVAAWCGAVWGKWSASRRGREFAGVRGMLY